LLGRYPLAVAAPRENYSDLAEFQFVRNAKRRVQSHLSEFHQNAANRNDGAGIDMEYGDALFNDRILQDLRNRGGRIPTPSA
jgi:hypothetical protein